MTGVNKMAALLTLILGLVLLAPVGAVARTVEIMDLTWVQGYYHGSASAALSYGWGWTDIIGSPTNPWDIKKVDITWTGGQTNEVKMQIFTNYQPAGLEGAGQADIALKLNSTANWSYGISMAGVNGFETFTSALVPVTTWKNSGDPSFGWSTGNWIYAGAYNPTNVTTNPQTPILTRIDAAGASLGAATVTYLNLISQGDGRPSDYEVDVIFPLVDSQGNNWSTFDFMVKSGTCGNDTIVGTALGPPISGRQVPVPASVLLLGTGLAGLVGLRRRRRQES